MCIFSKMFRNVITRLSFLFLAMFVWIELFHLQLNTALKTGRDAIVYQKAVLKILFTKVHWSTGITVAKISTSRQQTHWSHCSYKRIIQQSYSIKKLFKTLNPNLLYFTRFFLHFFWLCFNFALTCNYTINDIKRY